MSEWRKVTLGTITRKVGSGATPRGGKGAYVSSGISLIRSMNVLDGRFNPADLAFITDEQAGRLANVEVEEGDVLLNITGASVARCCLAPRAVLPARVNQHVAIIRLDRSAAVPRFVQSYLVSPEGKGRLLALAQGGATREALTKGTIEGFSVPLPAVKIQERIGAVLDAIDDLIENNRRRIALLEQTAEAIYREWFVHFRYPGHEDEELVDSPFGPIPGGWETSDVGSETLNFDRLRKPLSRRERSERPGGFPYYGAARVIDSIDNYLFDGDYLLVAEDGSVVTEAGFPILQRVRGQFWVSNHAHVLQGAGRVTITFLELALEEYPIMGHVTGAAQPKVTQANLNRIRLLVPTPNVMTAFSDAVEPVVDEQFVLAAACAVLEQTRDALLPKLVTGAIDVSELDLDALLDETAA